MNKYGQHVSKINSGHHKDGLMDATLNIWKIDIIYTQFCIMIIMMKKMNMKKNSILIYLYPVIIVIYFMKSDATLNNFAINQNQWTKKNNYKYRSKTKTKNWWDKYHSNRSIIIKVWSNNISFEIHSCSSSFTSLYPLKKKTLLLLRCFCYWNTY